ncbi:hypothetical protein P4O66_008131, partial [Electrophorus voltai]
MADAFEPVVTEPWLQAASSGGWSTELHQCSHGPQEVQWLGAAAGAHPASTPLPLFGSMRRAQVTHTSPDTWQGKASYHSGSRNYVVSSLLAHLKKFDVKHAQMALIPLEVGVKLSFPVAALKEWAEGFSAPQGPEQPSRTAQQGASTVDTQR